MWTVVEAIVQAVGLALRVGHRAAGRARRRPSYAPRRSGPVETAVGMIVVVAVCIALMAFAMSDGAEV